MNILSLNFNIPPQTKAGETAWICKLKLECAAGNKIDLVLMWDQTDLALPGDWLGHDATVNQLDMVRLKTCMLPV